ncbi:hypothetical protein LTR95_006472 [Oleoguttula sp. CCFEE 5521]
MFVTKHDVVYDECPADIVQSAEGSKKSLSEVRSAALISQAPATPPVGKAQKPLAPEHTKKAPVAKRTSTANQASTRAKRRKTSRPANPAEAPTVVPGQKRTLPEETEDLLAPRTLSVYDMKASRKPKGWPASAPSAQGSAAITSVSNTALQEVARKPQCLCCLLAKHDCDGTVRCQFCRHTKCIYLLCELTKCRGTTCFLIHPGQYEKDTQEGKEVWKALGGTMGQNELPEKDQDSVDKIRESLGMKKLVAADLGGRHGKWFQKDNRPQGGRRRVYQY